MISLRDQYNFEYGTDKEVDGVIVNDKCKALAKEIKDIIDTKSSFADWLNNQNVRNQLKLDIKIYLVKNGYPPQYSPEVFNKVMEQVENFEEYSGTEGIGSEATTSGKIYEYAPGYKEMMVAEDSSKYGDSKIISREVLNMKYMFFYDETEHSRKLIMRLLLRIITMIIS